VTSDVPGRRWIALLLLLAVPLPAATAGAAFAAPDTDHPEEQATPADPQTPPAGPPVPPEQTTPAAAERTGRPSEAPLTWGQVGADARYVFGRPAHLDGRGWVRLALAIGVGVSLYAVRDEAREFAQDHGSESVDQILDRARLMSRLATPLLVSGSFYLTGVARDSAYDKETSVLVLENLGYAAGITGVAQRVVATQRPRNGDDIEFFGGREGHSVSGDVVLATSILAPIIERHLLPDDDDGKGVRFWKRFGAGALYGGAGLVALQRINVDAHWLPDVYFGYVCGLGVGKLLVDSRRGGRDWREERRGRGVQTSVSASGISIVW
jgi:hypothetical protein